MHINKKNKRTTFNILAVIIILLNCITIANALSTNNVTAYYPLGNYTDIVNGNNIVEARSLVNTSTCKIGDCYYFNATNKSHANVSDSNSLDLTGNYTINVWIKLDSNSTSMYIVTKQALSSYPSYSLGLRYSSGYQIASYTASDEVYSSTIGLNTNEWYMITESHCGASSGQHLWYKNGALVSTSTVANPTAGTQKLGIGRWMDNNYYVNGTMDELAIWKDKCLNASEIAELYNSGAGRAYPFTIPENASTINFVSQDPSDITTSNLFGTRLNITYNVTDASANLSTIKLNYTLPNNEYVNGTSAPNNYYEIYTQNNSNISYSWLLNDNRVYPATYNYNETIMEATPHNEITQSSTNNLWSIELLNVNNSKAYNQYELMINSTGNTEIFYCNSSYSTGNPAINTNCVLINTFSSTTYNHSHNQSYHNVFSLPINTTTGKIGNIAVTSTSYFIIKPLGTSIVNLGYINISSRNNAFKQSTNNGATWTSNNTLTIDSHLHQYNLNDYIEYNACYSNATTTTCTSTRTDTYNLTPLPPSSPNIITPINQNYPYNTTLTINYSASQGYTTGINITSYNMSLLNSDFSFNKTINASTTSLTQTFNASNISNFSTGTYYIKVEATDTNGLTSFDISEPFNITSLLVIKFKNAYTNTYQTNFTGWVYSGGLNQTFNSGNESNVTLNVLNGLVQVYVERDNYSITTSNYYNFTLNTTPQILNLTMSIYTTNSIYILIKDESTANLINQSILLELQYLNMTIGNYNTSTGILYIDNLTDGEYTLVFSGGFGVNYTARTYIVSVADRSTQTLNAFLTISGNSVIIKTADSFSQEILQDATISLYKSINNTWSLIEIKDTDITGRAQFSYVPLTKYRFIIQKTGYITKSFDLNPILYSSYDVLLDRQIVYTFTGSQEDVKITWTPQQYFANETTNFTMIFSSATGVLNSYGVNISAPCTSYNFSGNNSIGETFQQSFTINCSHYRDTINITYYYTSVGNPQKIYHAQYFISGTYSASSYTWINMRQNHFGMGLLERIFIVVLLALIVGGTSYLMIGGIGALLLSLFIFGYFLSTGFIPMWSVIISLISGIFLLLGGKD